MSFKYSYLANFSIDRVKLSNIFKDECYLVFNELSSKYNLSKKLDDIVIFEEFNPNKVSRTARAYIDYTEAPIKIGYSIDRMISRWNLMTEFTKDSYSNDISIYVKDQAAHEICHLITYLIDSKNIFELKGHNKLFSDIYNSIRSRYTWIQFRTLNRDGSLHTFSIDNSDNDIDNADLLIEFGFNNFSKKVIDPNLSSWYVIDGDTLILSKEYLNKYCTSKNIDQLHIDVLLYAVNNNITDKSFDEVSSIIKDRRIDL